MLTDVGFAAVAQAFRGRRVLVTGHNGFKGTWLSLWLEELGADVWGYSLAPEPSTLFATIQPGRVSERVGDITDMEDFGRFVAKASPEVIFHLAAQPLVRRSFLEPHATVAVNILGTANLLEIARKMRRACTIIVVSSDKCYAFDKGSDNPHSERDALGGDDPYSASKAAAEIVVDAYRKSFFLTTEKPSSPIALASVRAGNTIGGGDWAADRIVPDSIRALLAGQVVRVRNPTSVRPWQHVLEPLAGYLMLAARLLRTEGTVRAQYCGPWNFGPISSTSRTVQELVEVLIQLWGQGSWMASGDRTSPDERLTLRLDSEKAATNLGWRPRWTFNEALERTVAWYKAYADDATPEALRAVCVQQIREYARVRERPSP